LFGKSASSPLPAATSKPGDPKTVTLTQSVSITVPYRTVGIHPGTILPLISRVGSDKVRVRYHGADYDIPLSATDRIEARQNGGPRFYYYVAELGKRSANEIKAARTEKFLLFVRAG